MKAFTYNLKLFLSLTLLSFILLLLDNLHFLVWPKAFLEYLTIPVEYGFYQSGKALAQQFNFLTSARSASQQNLALKKQLAELLTENALLRSAILENKALIDQQSGLNPKTFDLLSARIIGTGRYITLDKGTLDGVKVDQAVVYKENFIGQIKRADPKTSQVILSLDPDSKIAVFAQNKEGRAQGILIGRFGSEAVMEKILHEESIELSNLVYSAGTEGTLPRGLIMGKVTKVLDNPNDVFKQAQVFPLFEINDLDIVFIVKNT